MYASKLPGDDLSRFEERKTVLVHDRRIRPNKKSAVIAPAVALRDIRKVFGLGVQYLLRPAHGGSEVDASVSIEGHGLFGRLLAKATEALLAAGAVRSSLERAGRELEPALTA